MHRRHCLQALVAAAIWPIFELTASGGQCPHGIEQDTRLRDAEGTRTTLTYDEQGRVVNVIQYLESK